MHAVSPELLRRRRITRFVCVAAMALMLWGCGRSGPKYWPLSGKVTFRGKPVAVGLVRFSNPKVGVDVVAELDADGKYVVVTTDREGLPEGDYQVAVMPDLKSAKFKTTPGGLVLPDSISSREMNPPDIPERYHEPTTSGLTMIVKAESNTFDVDMQPTR